MVIENGVLLEVEQSDIENGTFDNWEGIREIGNEAFLNLSNLESITIPSTVNKIGNSVFEGCLNLKYAYISNEVKSIGDSSFRNCIKLEYVKLPSKLKVIESSLFAQCNALTDLNIPKGIKIIKESAFSNCIKLKDIILPSKLVSIEEKAFYNCHNLENVNLPKSLEYIGAMAFFLCELIEEIEIPEKITSLPEMVFFKCINLKKAILNKKIKKIDSKAFMFSGIEEVNFPPNLRHIGFNAFENCQNLKSIKLPEGIKTLSCFSFSNCTSLENISLPTSLEEIEEWAFYKCNIKTIKIPENVNYIGNSAFDSCESLEKIEFDENYEYKKRIGFTNCPNIKQIVYKNEIYNLKDYKSIFIEKYSDKNTKIINLILKLGGSYTTNHNILFPEELIWSLNKEGVTKLLEKDSVKHFKDIFNNYIYSKYSYRERDINAFYRFAYNLGCFNNEYAYIDGKNVCISQKACVFLKQLLDDGLLKITDCNDLFVNLKQNEYNVNFLKFITEIGEMKKYEFLDGKGEKETCYHNFMYLLSKEKKFGNIINDFEKIINLVITDSSGRIIKNPSMKKKIDAYLIKTSFSNIKTGNEDMVKEFIKFPTITQFDFQVAQNIRELGEKIPSHIIKEELKENDIMETIKEIQKQIVDETKNISEVLDELYAKEFTYEWLDKHDPKNFTLGLYCDCCASIVSIHYGNKIMKDSIIRDDVQNLVIKNINGDIIAKSTVYVNRNEGYAVFNDIEMNRTFGNEKDENDYSDDKKRDKIYKAFKRGVIAFIEKYNEQNKKRPIIQANIGWGYNRLKQIIKKYEEKSEEILEVIDSFEDAKEEQWIVYKK